MKERPILFSGRMVRSILAGKKTQTRRLIRDQPDFAEAPKWFAMDDGSWRVVEEEYPGDGSVEYACPYGQPGDRLWVRETFAGPMDRDFSHKFAYAADTQPGSEGDRFRIAYGIKWKPSIHMPRKASRLTLEVTGVRVERLQEISETDSLAEGITCALNDSMSAGWGDPGTIPTHNNGAPLYRLRNGFRETWDFINAKRGFGWAENPWVWVMEFNHLLNPPEEKK